MSLPSRSSRDPRIPSPGNNPVVLRATTFLAPGIPLRFFEVLTEYLSRVLDREIQLSSESRSSGPMRGHFDPFAADRCDLGFLCSPSYLYLSRQAHPSVDLVPAGFVFRDPRYRGRPVYYSELVVRADQPAQRLSDLAGVAWGFNDECSLSGYFAALQSLHQMGTGPDFFGQRVRTGSHRASIAAILDGGIGAAAIDSNVLALFRREFPEAARDLRVIESWGPFPIQPVVVRRGLPGLEPQRIARALSGIHTDAEAAAVLSEFLFERCAPLEDAAFRDEYRALCELGQLSG